MIKFDEKYFGELKFTKEQIKKNLANAMKDLRIAKADKIPEVKFTYTYSALIKGGIALLSFYNWKIKSAPGHHIKIIETVARILSDNTIEIIGNAMRSKRNLDFYNGGIMVTRKESQEYLRFVDSALKRIEKIIS